MTVCCDLPEYCGVLVTFLINVTGERSVDCEHSSRMWSVMASGVWGSWPHCTHSQQAKRDKGWYSVLFFLFYFSFLFYYIWDPCPSDDVTHIQWGFSFQWDYSLEMYSQARPEVYLLGDPKSRQVDSEE